MSHPSRPRARGPAQPRRRRLHKIEAVQSLEDRALLAPVVTNTFNTVALVPPTGTPTPANLGSVSVTTTTQPIAPAALTSVTELTSNAAFGGDIVRIKAGPGGDFGKGVYAISRGAGENANPSNRAPNTPAPINRPGVIYRVDPATGRSSIFFDLNTVINQLEPGGTAANSAGAQTGLVNWYDMTFDPEGYFDGRPSLFVSSVDATDPNKNVIFRIGSDGSFLGAFSTFSSGSSTLGFNAAPSAILTPPPEQQSFLRGLLVGDGLPNTNPNGTPTGLPGVDISGGSATAIGNAGATGTLDFQGFFFDANAFRPGTPISDVNNLPTGASRTETVFGPQVGLTAANTNYASPDYAAFTNFGIPGAAGIPAVPGLSGVQGIGGTPTNALRFQPNNTGALTALTTLLGNYGGDLLIQPPAAATAATASSPNGLPNTVFDVSLARNGTFGTDVTAQIPLVTAQPTATTGSGVDQFSLISTPFRRFQDIAFDQYGYFSYSDNTAVAGTTAAATVTSVPVYRGNLFVSDLASGLALSVTIPAVPAGPNGVPAAIPAQTIAVPIQGPGGSLSATLDPTTGNYNPVLTNGNTTEGSNFGGRIIRITPNGQVSTFAQNFHTSADQTAASFAQSELSITFSADGTTLYASDDDGIWQFKSVASLAGSTSGSITGLNDLRTLGVPYEGQNSAVAIVDTGVDAKTTSFRGRVATGTNILFNGPGNDDTAPGSFATTTTTTTTTTGFANGHGTQLAGIVAQFVPQATLEPVDVFAPTTSTATGGTGTGTTANTSPDILYQGLQYTADHPFVSDPIRPNKQDRVVAANFGFGTQQTFPTEVAAYKRFPQYTIAMKNQFHRLRNVGITPIAAAGQFGSQNGTAATGGTAATLAPSDVNGMSLPAVFNEVVSVTGTYPFPIDPGPRSTPLVDFVGIVPRFPSPFLLTGATGGTGGTTLGGGLAGGTAGGATTGGTGPAALAADDATIFKDKLLSTVNRSILTDFAAPALDVPTFKRTTNATTTGTTGTTGTGALPGGNNPATLDFTQAGTSLSAAITTGAFAMVGSALDYWSTITPTGATVDAYLTEPVGVRALNFGPHVLKDLSAYANPDGVNAILQWTAVPAKDDPNTYADAIAVTTGTGTGGTTANNPTVQRLFGSASPRSFSRISVSNAVAAIEGTIALDYLLKHGTFNIIDADKNGLITAQEIQNFVDTSTSMGLPEAGAMARLLGGTARIPGFGNPETANGESPDQPDVLQRRFNFFDYAANGKLAGVISVQALQQLSQKLLPNPDDFVIIDRQRSSGDRYLLDPNSPRATQDLQHLVPTNEFIPAAKIARFRGVSPQAFHIGRAKGHFVNPFTIGPTFTLFDTPPASKAAANHKTATPTPAATPPPSSSSVASQSDSAPVASSGSASSTSNPTAPTTDSTQSQAPTSSQSQAPTSSAPATSATTTTATPKPAITISPAVTTPAPATTSHVAATPKAVTTTPANPPSIPAGFQGSPTFSNPKPFPAGDLAPTTPANASQSTTATTSTKPAVASGAAHSATKATSTKSSNLLDTLGLRSVLSPLLGKKK